MYVFFVECWFGYYLNSDHLPFLLIDLGKSFKLTKLYVEGSGSYYTTSFNVLYTLDNVTWTAYSDSADGTPTNLLANDGSDTTVPVYFRSPFLVGYNILFVK